MKATIIKINRKKEVINREEVGAVAAMIRDGAVQNEVRQLRHVYHLMRTQRMEDGRMDTDVEGGIRLPRVCFAADYEHRDGSRHMLEYNGLVVIEMNGLKSYEEAVALREQVRRMPQTLMAFLGASGRSVKVVVKGELYPDSGGGRPKDETDIANFHLNIYRTARQAYQSQFGIDIEWMEPRLDRTVYLSADPDMYYNPAATPFYADTLKAGEQPAVSISEESDTLMPGRTIERSWQLNWLFVVEDVLGRYFELPDDERLMQLLMQIASRCLAEGIPQAKAQDLTMEYPVLNTDPLLVKKVFSTVYAVTQQEDYMKKHNIKPLKSIPDETLQTMRTEILPDSLRWMKKQGFLRHLIIRRSLPCV